MLNLPADNAPGLFLSFPLRIESIKHGEATHDRRKRIAEFVPQHGQEVILGLADSLGFGAGGAEFRHDSLAHRQVVSRIVLPSASPERDPHGRHQGGGSNRPLQETHIPVRSEQLKRAQIRARRLSSGREDHKGQVGPRRLSFQGLEQELCCRRCKHFFGEQHRTGACHDAFAECFNPGTGRRGYPGSLQGGAYQRAIAAHRSEDQDRLPCAANRCGHPFPALSQSP